MCAQSVDAYDDEAEQRQHERDVDGGVAEDDLLVDDGALQWRHERSAHDGHDEEGRPEGGVLRVYVLKGNAVDGREHERHEEADAHEAVEPHDAHDADGPYGAECRAEGKDGEQHAGVDIAHEEGGDEAAGEEEGHGHDVVCLCRGLVDAQVVGILYDECPCHDLCSHVEHLCHHALAVDGVVPEVAQRHPCGVRMSQCLLLLALCLRHLRESDDDEDREHHESYGHVWVAYDGEVV